MRNEDVRFKTSLEVARIRRSCKIIESIFDDLCNVIKSGISTSEIADFCKTSMETKLAKTSALGYRGYPATICTSVNSVAVHGLPSEYLLVDGDILTVDIILNTDGWHGDGAYTYIVGKGDPDILRLYRAAKEATYAGIKAARAGNRLGDVGFAISNTAARWGCSIIESLAGHGIGLDVHEDPVVLPVGEPHVGMPIVPGMVFTIEPVLTLGSGKIGTLEDGWSIITSDGRQTAQFEHTIAIFGMRTEVLTRPELSFSFEIN
ncbi:MAG: type I methionyl aminopeptidase [Spirochaetales bacterium]|nr:type I methionyl aminopeptidase [Spirochaetales bacterium]